SGVHPGEQRGHKAAGWLVDSLFLHLAAPGIRRRTGPRFGVDRVSGTAVAFGVLFLLGASRRAQSEKASTAVPSACHASQRAVHEYFGVLARQCVLVVRSAARLVTGSRAV